MTDPRIEVVANTLMDLRMDGPWSQPPSTKTYQEAMRHYAALIVKALPPQGIDPNELYARMSKLEAMDFVFRDEDPLKDARRETYVRLDALYELFRS